MNGIEACFVGRLGRDAELRMVKGGELPLVSFSAAVEEKVQAADAQPQWVRVVAFGDLTEQMAERLVKGTKVYVEGKLEASIWQPEAGPRRLNLNVTATTVQPIGQIGRQRPRPTRNAQRGAQTWHRARHVGQRKAQQTGEALLRAAPHESSRRRDNPEPPAAWLDDTDLAVADLEGRGR